MPQEQTPTPTPVTPEPRFKPVHAVLIGAGALALLMLSFAFGMYISAPSDVKPSVVVQDDQPTDTDEPTDGDDQDGVPAQPPLDTKEFLAVDWFPVTEQKETEFPYELRSALEEADENFRLMYPQFRAFELGTVTAGEFESATLVDAIVATEGMGTWYQHYYVIVPKSGSRAVLQRYYNAIETGHRSMYDVFEKQQPSRDISLYDVLTTRDDITLSNLKLAQFERPHVEKATSGPQEEFVRMDWQERVDYPEKFDASKYPFVATLESGLRLQRYLTDLDRDEAADDLTHFFGVQEDGRVVWYDAVLPFWPTELPDEEAMYEGQSSLYIAVPELVFGNKANTMKYSKGTVGGCGFGAVVHVVDPSDIGAVAEIGHATSDSSVKVYAPTSYDRPYYADAIKQWQMMHKGSDVSAFDDNVPYFYYTDAFGRFLEFASTDVVPPGECGKPVIYLYPEETTDISVQLWPQGGFTVTEPAYNNGWNVTASPDGTLVNKADGLTYPYLFWEGRGAAYATPNKFWVVKRENVHTFLVSTLAKLGLNKQETADFMEFWEPRMQAAPYYKIGFHGTSTMDLIAPMKLSEQPDTVLRILMDYEELQAPIQAKPPVLPAAPVREGFTVIEWGGVLR